MELPDTTVLLSLMAKARAPLQLQLASDPGDPVLVRRLADLCRTLGDLDAAADYYARLTGMADESADGAQMARLMRGHPGTEGWDDTPGHAVPFVRHSQFLPETARDEILSYALENEQNFELLMVCLLYTSPSPRDRG